MNNPERAAHRRATFFVILMGVVSLFADVTYEGARSISGPFLSVLGASSLAVGLAAGAGEFIGYSLRFVTGYLSDRSRRYWLMTLLGYAVNVLAIPLLAFARNWQEAVFLLIMERMGKAVRTPARDAMLSYAAGRVGHGMAFGLHEALDQIGAVTGPLVVAFVLFSRGDYRAGFAVLWVPAILALCVLLAARFIYPKPREMENSNPEHFLGESFKRPFWLFTAASAFVAAGFVDFPLLAFHLERTVAFDRLWIPLFYSVAMGVDALAALFFGWCYDRKGAAVILAAVGVCVFFPPLVLFGGFWGAMGGMALWGVGMGAQESVMRAAVSRLVGPDRRATAFGIYNGVFGFAWFAGSAAIGALYGFSPLLACVFSMGMMLLALPVYFASTK